MCHIHLCHPDDSYQKCLAFKPLDTQTQTLRKNKRTTDTDHSVAECGQPEQHPVSQLLQEL